MKCLVPGALVVGACTSDLTEDFSKDNAQSVDGGVLDAGTSGEVGDASVSSNVQLEVVESEPANGQSGVSVAADVVLTVDGTLEAGAGNILIQQCEDDGTFATLPVGDDARVAFDGSQLTLMPDAALRGDTCYYLEFEVGAIVLDGQSLEEFGGEDFYSFSTGSVALPGDVSDGLVGWFDSTDTATLRTSDGEVLAWGNRSGSGGRLVPRSTAAPPSIEPSGIAASPAVSFDGESSLSGGAVLPQSDDTFTIFAVWQADVSTDQVVFQQGGSVAEPGTTASLVATEAGEYGFAGESDNASAQVYADGVAQVTVVKLAGSDEVGLLHNGRFGASVIDIAAQDVGAEELSIGGEVGTGNRGFSGRLGELIFYDRVLTFAEEQAVQSYLADRWEIDLLGPQFVSSEPANGATEVEQHANIVLTFDREVFPGTGEVSIRNSVDDSVVERVDVGSESLLFDGNTLTVDVSGLLASGSGFYVTVDDSAVVDDHDGRFVGFRGTTDLAFQTVELLPASLVPDVLLWLDASYASSLEEEDGRLVRWLDRSGNNRHASQSAAEQRPEVIDNAVGGRSVVRFGENEAMTSLETLLSFDPGPGFAVVGVVRFRPNPGNQDTVVHLRAGTGAARPIFYRDLQQSEDFCAFTDAQILCAPDAVRYDYQLLGVNYDGVNASLFVDAVEEASADVSIGSNEGQWLIGSMDGIGFLTGEIAELIIIDGELTDSDTVALALLMSDAWGVPNRQQN